MQDLEDENPFANGNAALAFTSGSILALNPFIQQLKETFQDLVVPENNNVVVLNQAGEVNTYEVEDVVEVRFDATV